MTKLLTLVFLIAVGAIGVATYQVLVDDGVLPPLPFSSTASAPGVSDPRYGTGIVNVQYESTPRPNNRDLPQDAVPDVGTTPNPRLSPRFDCDGTHLGYLRSEMQAAHTTFVQNGTQWNHDNYVYAKQRYDSAIARCSGY